MLGRSRRMPRVSGLAPRSLSTLLVVSLAAVLIGAATSARGSTASYDDADESASALDIARIRHSHRVLQSGQGILRHKLRTHDSWETSLLEQAEVAAISLHFDTNRDRDPATRGIGFCGEGYERIMRVKLNEDGSLYGEISNARNRILGYARVWRPDDRSVILEFPKRSLRKKLSSYHWCADTAYHEESQPSDQCGESDGVFTLCTDRAPKNWALFHKLH